MARSEFYPGDTGLVKRSIEAAEARRRSIQLQIAELQKQDESLGMQIASWQAELDVRKQPTYPVVDPIAAVARVFKGSDISWPPQEN
jgi:hypothetical protein